MPGEMVIIKNPLHTKRIATRLVHDPRHFPDTLNLQFFTAPIRRWKQYLDPDIRPDRGTLAAENQSPIQRHIAREAALGMLLPIIPVEDDRQLKLVPNRYSALGCAL